MKAFINEDIDWISTGIYLSLVIFGWLNIFAVSYAGNYTSIFDLSKNYGQQLIWILISFVIIVFIFAIDHRFYHFFAYAIYALFILLLLAVLVFGVEINSSQSWFRIAGFNFQPSEFVKVASLLALARYLSSFDVKVWTKSSIGIISMIIGIPVLLIVLQPDWGTAMVFSCFAIVLYREGLPGWILGSVAFIIVLFLLTLLFKTETVITGLIVSAFIAFSLISKKKKYPLIGALIITALYFISHFTFELLEISIEIQFTILISLAVSSLVYLIISYKHKIQNIFITLAILFSLILFSYSVDYVFNNFLKPHQQNRVNIMLGKVSDTKNAGYNLNQSKIAIGSGGFLGKGFLQGTQTKFNFVPEQTTDFIFCTVGEEWGFIGAFVLVALFTGLLARILFLAERQKSKFARIYGYGVLSIIGFHFIINISMTIGLFPVIGIPLPNVNKICFRYI